MRIGPPLVLIAALAMASSLAAAGPAADAGVFGGYHYIDPQDLPWNLRGGVSVRTAVGSDATGNQLTPCASMWKPLGRAAFVGFGAGFTWSSDGSLGQGLGAERGAASTTALPAHAAGAGVRGLHAGPAVVVRLGPEWFAAGGAFYMHSTGGAASSPMVTPHDDRNRWGIGVGLDHAWR